MHEGGEDKQKLISVLPYKNRPENIRSGQRSYSLSIIAMERSARALGSAGAGQADMSSEAF